MAHVVSKEIGTSESGQEVDTADTRRRERALSMSDLGVSMTLTGPDEIFVGEPFSWDVFVINRSSKSRKLAITVVPRRRTGDLNTQLSNSSISSRSGGNDVAIAGATVDDNQLYAVQRNTKADKVQVISLTNDLKIGWAPCSHYLYRADTGLQSTIAGVVFQRRAEVPSAGRGVTSDRGGPRQRCRNE